MPIEKEDTTVFTRVVYRNRKQSEITVPKLLVDRVTKRKPIKGTFKLFIDKDGKLTMALETE